MAKRKRRQTVTRDGLTHSYRRVIRAGNSVAITLPAEYCREHNVELGDEFILAANSIITMVKKSETGL